MNPPNSLFARFAQRLKNRIPFRSGKTIVLSKNYDDPLIAEYVTRKTMDGLRNTNSLDFNSQNYRYFALFAFLSDHSGLRVLDFGGGAGQHFYSLEKYFSNRISNWTVVETKSMVVAASKVVANTRLRFEESISSIINQEFDFVLASSSIQYSKNPIKTLEELINVNARYMFITRMPVWDNPTTTVIQKSRLSSNGPGRQLYEFEDGVVEYQLTILNREIFERYFEERFEQIFCSLESEGVHKIEGRVVSQYGYLFRNKELA